ncbi:MAG: carboxypeptidase regulatory-like domain-containing protein [Planctomycetes bacterium]|nr:carboxypeptidase regulatory-like domain-containing protein [Planctomycetota bacterium]
MLVAHVPSARAAVPGAHERGGRARRAWLARVLLNLARRRARGESSRAERERAAARPEASQDDVVARAEAARRSVELVMELEEPYRSTLLRHDLDGLAPGEIARRTGANASTVRTRIERGLARLRARLDRRDGRAWIAALVPVALDRGAVDATAAGVGATITKGFVMSSAAKIGVAVAGVLALAVWFWPVDGGAPAPTGPREHALAPSGARGADEHAAELTRPELPDAGRGVPAGEGSGFAAPAAEVALGEDEIAVQQRQSEPGFLGGLVLRGDRPIAGGTLWFWRGYWRPLPPAPETALGAVGFEDLERAPIGADGRFRVGPLATDAYSLGVDVGAGIALQTFVRVDAQRRGRRLVLVLGSAAITGRVWDARGVPVEGAAVWAVCNHDPGWLEVHGLTDASGHYHVAGLEPRAYWVSVDLAGRRGPASETSNMRLIGSLAEGETRSVDFGEPASSARWRGHLRLVDGSTPPLGGSLTWKDASGGYSELDLGPDAAFDLRLAPGAVEFWVRLSTTNAGQRTDSLELGTHAVGSADVERDLVVPGAVVAGRAFGVAPDAWPRGATLGLAWPDGRVHRTTAIDADGSFRFLAVPPGRWRAVAGPVLEVAGEAQIDVRAGDVTVPFDVALRRR